MPDTAATLLVPNKRGRRHMGRGVEQRRNLDQTAATHCRINQTGRERHQAQKRKTHSLTSHDCIKNAA